MVIYVQTVVVKWLLTCYSVKPSSVPSSMFVCRTLVMAMLATLLLMRMPTSPATLTVKLIALLCCLTSGQTKCHSSSPRKTWVVLMFRWSLPILFHQGLQNLYGKFGEFCRTFKSWTEKHRFSLPLWVTWCHQIAQVCNYIFTNFPVVTPSDPITEGAFLLPRLLPLSARSPSHFIRASAADMSHINNWSSQCGA